jgi:hypothetical protein
MTLLIIRFPFNFSLPMFCMFRIVHLDCFFLMLFFFIFNAICRFYYIVLTCTVVLARGCNWPRFPIAKHINK